MFGIRINLGHKIKWAPRPDGKGRAEFRTHLAALEQLMLWWPEATYRTYYVERIEDVLC